MKLPNILVEISASSGKWNSRLCKSTQLLLLRQLCQQLEKKPTPTYLKHVFCWIWRWSVVIDGH